MDSRSGAAVEAFHEAGYDYLLIDREHTALNSETILEHIRLCRALDFPCVVRVAQDSYAELNRTLDQLPDGIFVPRICTRQQVERVLETVKYAPHGKRGVGGSTCPAGRYMGWPSLTDQLRTVNENTMVGIQIETAEALEDLDGILSVPGVDAAVVGNDDLSVGMGIPGQWDSREYRNAVEEVIAACQRHGVMPGIAGGDPQFVKHWAERGMRMFWIAADICLLWEAAARQCRAVRDVVAGGQQS
jgi:2-dehydro-3-deoxyglucarate aldolase/4-hydroxy-2-oxoheptanedioate aldolase